MDRLRLLTGQKADDLLNQGGLLTKHKNIKGIDSNCEMVKLAGEYTYVT